MSRRDVDRPADHEQEPAKDAPVSGATVPLLGLGLVVGFLGGYLLGWWGAVVVGVVLVAGLSAVIAGRGRDAETAAVLGTGGGYLDVLFLAGGARCPERRAPHPTAGPRGVPWIHPQHPRRTA